MLYLTDEYTGAAQILEEALGISRDVADRALEASTLNSLGTLRYLTGDYPGSARFQEEAVDICREIGDQSGQAYGLNGLGRTWLASAMS